MILLGTAGWGVPRASKESVPVEGTGLQRYAAVMDCVEINSSFYRPHRPQTYARWASTTPASFRISAKIPKAITHDARLLATEGLLDRFLPEVAGLGAKSGPLILQLPRSFEFDDAVLREFLVALRVRWMGPVVCEPRHASWFARPAERALAAFAIGRVAADPPAVPAAACPLAAIAPGDASATYYFRMHGSPRTYWSPYSTAFLKRLARTLRALPPAAHVWCVFDNTASGSALGNALELKALLGR